MNTVLDFILAAAPWVAMGLLLVIFCIRSAVNKKKGKKQSFDYGMEGLSLGMCFGLLIGTVFGDNLSIGVSFGALVGLAVGMCVPKNSENDEK